MQDQHKSIKDLRVDANRNRNDEWKKQKCALIPHLCRKSQLSEEKKSSMAFYRFKA